MAKNAAEIEFEMDHEYHAGMKFYNYCAILIGTVINRRNSPGFLRCNKLLDLRQRR